MLGVPKEDRARFQRWSAALLAGGVLETPARRAAAFQANRELSDYFVEIIAERRSKPGPDILSALIRVQEEDGDRLNTRELIGTCILLLIAGHAGTSAMIGNGLLTLARHPEQRALLRADKSLWPSAVEEMLRFEGAVPSMVRVATEEMRIHGKLLRKGQNVELVLASANRDPDVFEDPDRFDITRHPNDHLGLGRGSHFCLGASLARMEMRIALDEFVERFPAFDLASSEVHWNPRGFRTLLELPIRARC
jgi:cytochrome P450